MRVLNNKFVVMGLFVLMQILVIAAAFTGGVLYRELADSAGVPEQSTDLPLLHRAQKLLFENAYDPIPAAPGLEYGMIKGMLQTLNDPFTSFYEPPQTELQANTLEGHYGGIGVRLDRDAQGYIYLYPLPSSPALKAGVQEGDRLVKVGGKDILPQMKIDEIQAAIRGKAGEKVTITVSRPPDFSQSIDYAIERADVPLPSVTWNLAPNQPLVGVVQVHVMADPTPKEVTNAINDLKARGAKYFVLDLRDNGGGFVDSGVNTARLFLKSGVIIQEQYHNQPIKSYTVDQPGIFSDLQVAILVNKGTASAAEIFAGALQGQKRAKLVGSPTFGKDSIQLVFDLGDGSSLHITSARWWVPGIGPIKGKGLQPDVTAADNAPVPPLQAAIQLFISSHSQ